MGLDPRLLEILVCPECRVPVEPVDDETGLRCGSCGRVYPVRDGNPIMLIDEARMPDDPAPTS